MRGWKTLLFAMLPALALAAGLEGLSRAALASGWLRGGPWRVPALEVTEIGLTLHGGDRRICPDPYNGYRLRDADDPASRRPPRLPLPPKRPGETRVLCLGDSVAYGIYLTEREAWPARLQERVNAWAPPGTRIEVYNGAVLGYGAPHCKRLYQSRYRETRPDVILWDEEPDFDDTPGLPPVMSERRVRWTQRLCRSRFLYLLRLVARSRATDSGFDFYNLPAETRAGTQRDVMRTFVRRVMADGVAAVLGVEYLADMGRSSSNAGYREIAPYVPRDFSPGGHPESPLMGNGRKWTARGLEYVACLDRFQEHPGGPGPLFLDRIHLTAAGSDLLASIVSEHLRRRWPEIAPRAGSGPD